MTLNCNGKIIDFSTKKIMGIVNISEDSFYDGGKFNTIEKVNVSEGIDANFQDILNYSVFAQILLKE
ncbi:nucleotide modification associated domain-containing protein [Flavobacteriaceae bacterium]|nr:nucleotide modification associated domain-containing protein [Flavobacteriaceae bacterium]